MATINGVENSGLIKLIRSGADIAHIKRSAQSDYFDVDLVVDNARKREFESYGFRLALWPSKEVQMEKWEHKSYDVYRDYDSEGGIVSQLENLTATYSTISELQEIGATLKGRKILAVRITNLQNDDHKPKILFVGCHHGREWVSVEVPLRLIKYFLENYGSDPEITQLVDAREIYFVPVLNPDGYQYTFDNDRLWRKNLRDNNGNGIIDSSDGVDLNRNYDSFWGYDDLGSSPLLEAPDYRGTEPFSEPETNVLKTLLESNTFAFAISYHTYGNEIQYPWGYEFNLKPLDSSLFKALAGDIKNPAIWDTTGPDPLPYLPLLASLIYTANGGWMDWLYQLGTICFTIELTDEYGFEFPDDEGMLQTVFEDNLPFALDLIRSAGDPVHFDSHLESTSSSTYHEPISQAYGFDQIVHVIALNTIDSLSLNYAFKGETHVADFSLKEKGIFFNCYQGTMENLPGGGIVSYGIEAGDYMLGDYAFRVMVDDKTDVLLIADEVNPLMTDSPAGFISYYTDALEENGYSPLLWDVSQSGVPNYFEVLSHFKNAIWYTGNAENRGTLEMTDVLRKYLKNDGRLLLSGEKICGSNVNADFFIHYCGVYDYADINGPDSSLIFNVVGEGKCFRGNAWKVNGEGGAKNQISPTILMPTENASIQAFYQWKDGAINGNHGAIISNGQTLLFGFGLEAVSPSSSRSSLMRVAMECLNNEQQELCLIETMTLHSSQQRRVLDILRRFRNEYLLTSTIGKEIVSLYYKYGSVAARIMRNHPKVFEAGRSFLQNAAPLLQTNFDSADDVNAPEKGIITPHAH